MSKLFFGTQTQFLHCFSNDTDPISALFSHNLTLFLHYFPISALFCVFALHIFTVFSVLHPITGLLSDIYTLLCAPSCFSVPTPYICTIFRYLHPIYALFFDTRTLRPHFFLYLCSLSWLFFGTCTPYLHFYLVSTAYICTVL